MVIHAVQLMVTFFLICNLLVIFYWNECSMKYYIYETSPLEKYNTAEDFESFDNKDGTQSGEYIVPNFVHMIRFGNDTVTLIEAVCLLAALINQKPRKLMIHTDQVPFIGGKYWDIVSNHRMSKDVLEIKYISQPESIFGQELSETWRMYHAADVGRLQVLMTYGGIFLDGDSYIVRSLNDFRKYEMTLGWQEGGGISNQVIIAHRNARFLTEWYDSYRDYRKDEWFYNAGELPTEMLKRSSHLVHRVPRLLAEWKDTMKMIYLDNSDEWSVHYAIHLLINHQYLIDRNLSNTATYPVTFTEENIFNYEANIKSMVLAVYPFNSTHNSTHGAG